MNYATIKNCDIANGVGVRISLFVSGCTHRCKNCFNKEAWDFSYGAPFDENIENQILEMLAPSYIKGLSLLGGEPFEPSNVDGLLPFMRKVITLKNKDVWAYSGYTLEQLLAREGDEGKKTRELLSYIDILVDGPFIEEKKSLRLKFRGSSNQRIIDVKKTLESGEITLADIHDRT
ncbi:MAG: anaerobic ribonucleoside-triphosphate reductase activating protein [Clostridiales bacterium]|nr:anaerobic ribonucleoside-triphosphate reductase activating protein [Clostridiales bacterium]